MKSVRLGKIEERCREGGHYSRWLYVPSLIFRLKIAYATIAFLIVFLGWKALASDDLGRRPPAVPQDAKSVSPKSSTLARLYAEMPHATSRVKKSVR